MGSAGDAARAREPDEPTRLEPGGPNTVAVANGIVGDEWTLWIVQLALLQGATRYNDWLHAGPISSSVLTARLARLVEYDIMRRAAYSEHPPRYEYQLTDRGRQL